MEYEVTVTRPSSRAGHSLVVVVIATDELEVSDGGINVVNVVGEDSDEALEVVFQPHGLEVVLKTNEEVVGGNKVITLASLVAPG